MEALIVLLRVRPGMREAFLDAIRADAEASRRLEPGCLRFDVIAVADDPNRFVLYECYRDADAFAAHRRTEHFRRWREAAPLVLEPEDGQVNWHGTRLWSGDQPPAEAPTGPTDGSPAGLVLRRHAIASLDRGAGIHTVPYIGRGNAPGSRLTTGETDFAPGTALPLHHHNVEEQVLVLEGDADVEIGDRRVTLGPGDASWAPAGVLHRFANRGKGPLRIQWTYGGDRVTRTIAATGETVEHLSLRDRLGIAAD